MTPVKMISPNTSIWHFPPPANPLAPTANELRMARNISDAVLTEYRINPEASPVTEDPVWLKKTKAQLLEEIQRLRKVDYLAEIKAEQKLLSAESRGDKFEMMHEKAEEQLAAAEVQIKALRAELRLTIRELP